MSGCGIVAVILFIAVVIGFFVVPIFVLCQLLPLWAALLIGIPVGAVALALLYAEEHTLVEMIVTGGIMLILAIILMPVFLRANWVSQQKAQGAAFKSRIITNPQPPYPTAARQAGHEGTSWVRIEVTDAGRVKSVQIEESSGYKELDEAAIQVARRWQFKPKLQGDSSTASHFLQPFRFKLE